MNPPFAPRRLAAKPVTHASPEYREILTWTFAPEPFYIAQVARAVSDDLPQLISYQHAGLWVFTDTDSGELVGFGTLVINSLYSDLAGGLEHCYIPLLSAKPGQKGCGKLIATHLLGEASILVNQTYAGKLSDRVFLDVYTTNTDAINSYRKCGFEILNEEAPLLDPKENNAPYVVMARSVRVSH